MLILEILYIYSHCYWILSTQLRMYSQIYFHLEKRQQKASSRMWISIWISFSTVSSKFMFCKVAFVFRESEWYYKFNETTIEYSMERISNVTNGIWFDAISIKGRENWKLMSLVSRVLIFLSALFNQKRNKETLFRNCGITA